MPLETAPVAGCSSAKSSGSPSTASVTRKRSLYGERLRVGCSRDAVAGTGAGTIDFSYPLTQGSVVTYDAPTGASAIGGPPRSPGSTKAGASP